MPVHGVFFPVAQHAGIVTTDSIEHARATPNVEPRELNKSTQPTKSPLNEVKIIVRGIFTACVGQPRRHGDRTSQAALAGSALCGHMPVQQRRDCEQEA